MKGIYSYRNKQIINTKNVQKTATKYLPLYYIVTKLPNNNDFLISSFSTINIRGHKSKPTIKNKTSLTKVAKSLSSYYAAINKPNNGNLCILVFSMKNVRNCKNENANIKNSNNIHKKIILHIHTIKRQYYQKSCKIIIENNLDEGNLHKSNMYKNN